MYIRSDYIFSYWIFLWFILYLLKLVPYNPKLHRPKRKMRRFLWKHQTCNASRDKLFIKK